MIAAIVGHSTDAIFSVNRERAITSWNGGAERLYGFTAAEAVGRSVFELGMLEIPEGVNVLLRVREALRAGDSVNDLDTVVRHRGGSTTPVSITVSPIRDGAGAVIGAAAIARDITERRKQEEALRTLSLAFVQSPASVVITDAVGAITYVNPKFCAVTGYAPDEVLGQNARILQSGRTPPQVYEALWRTLQAGDPWQGTFLNRRKNGEMYWEHSSISPVAGAHGKITQYVAINEDVTERKRMESLLEQTKDVLERSERRHRALFEQAGVAMAEVAPDGAWQLVNARFCALFGYSAEELLHHNFLEITHQDDRARDQERVRTTDDSFTSTAFEKRFVRKDGAVVWVSATIAAVRDEQGKRTHDVGIFEDITARKQAEAATAASERQIRVLIEHAPDAIMVYDVEQQCLIDANQKAELLFDCSRAELLGGGPLRFLAFDEPDSPTHQTFHEHNQQALAGQEVHVERTIVSATGQVKHCEVRLVQLPTEGRRLLRVSCLDITARRRTEAAHRQLDRQFHEILRVAPVGAVILDEHGTIEYTNEAFAALHEYTVAALTGQSIGVLFPSEYREQHLTQYREQLASADGSTRSIDTVTSRGIHRVLEIATVQFEGLDGRQRGASFAMDRTERHRAEQRLAYSAAHDPLTGLPNRAFFSDRLAEELSRAAREHGTIAMLQVDLNRFKQVNDTLGHAAGDTVLSTAARRMREALRVQDTLARLGGDEFVALLPSADEQGAVVVAAKLRSAICEAIQMEHATVSVDASIGITIYPHHADEAAELLRSADLAMYAAKAKGGGTAVYSAEVEEQSAHSRELLHDLHVAADRGQLRLFFQPVMESDRGTVVRAEALLRWQHPTLGLLRPRRFLPTTDLSDTIDRVTLWVLDEALRQCALWHAAGKAVGVEVNTPVRSLRDNAFPNQVRDLLERHAVAPGNLTLTVSENTLMMALESVLPVLTTLSDMGVRIGLDEFGVGQSSLSALSRLPLRQIKVDRSFVAQATTTEGSSLIAMILGIAATLGLTAVADGVEQQDIWEWLRGLGQLELQGYSGGRPLPADEFAFWLATQ